MKKSKATDKIMHKLLIVISVLILSIFALCSVKWYGTVDASSRDISADNTVASVSSDMRLVVIDAGHQEHANYEKEPVGPGALESKFKVSSGTRGCVTKLPEYELNLRISQKLKTELEHRGYRVLMTRNANDVNISNSERAAIANDAKADVFVRIHANGSDNPEANGAMTICQTKDNPYNGFIYEKSKALAIYIIEEIIKSANCKKINIWETDTMSGINWCKVPAVIIEIGFMTNPKEDALLSDNKYQLRIVDGIANGIDEFCHKK